MDKFIVSARKYRPQTFNTVIGQKHITTTLKNAIQNNQLAHAYLFCGPRGVGKTTCARIFAKTINCEHPTVDGEACDQCHSCISFNEGTSLNIAELDAASNNSVDDIRTLVDQVRFPPQAGKYKVYIIDEVHMLSASAFNAFLKTLEEPPSYVIFILATTEKHKLLPTILSRCQIFDFKRITNNDTMEHLEEICEKEHVNAEKSALQIIAQKSEGCMRDALSIMDKIVSFTDGKITYANTLENLNILDYDYYFQLMDAVLTQDLTTVFLLFDEISKKGFEGDIVLNGLQEFMRNLLVAKDPKAATLMDVVDGLAEKYHEKSKKLDISFLLSGLNILNDAEINFKAARNKRLLVEMALIKLTYLQQAIEVVAEDNNQELVKKKRTNGPIAWKKQVLPQYGVIQSSSSKSSTSKIAESGATLHIENISTPKDETVIPATSSNTIENKNIHSTPSIQPPAQHTAPIAKKLQPLTKKIDLQSLMNQVEEKEASATIIVEQLNPSKLQSIWTDYSKNLEDQNNHTLANTFKSAQLTIVSETEFTIKVFAVIQSKFIEQERSMINDYIQNAFNNRAINFKIEIEENDVEPERPYLNSGQRFELMADKYPMLLKLKIDGHMGIEY